MRKPSQEGFLPVGGGFDEFHHQRWLAAQLAFRLEQRGDVKRRPGSSMARTSPSVSWPLTISGKRSRSATNSGFTPKLQW